MGRGTRQHADATAAAAAATAADIRDMLRGHRTSDRAPGWTTATVWLPADFDSLPPDAQKVRLDGFHADTVRSHLGGPGRSVRILQEGLYAHVDLDNGWAVGIGWNPGGPGMPRHMCHGHVDGGAVTAEVVVWDPTGRMVNLDPMQSPLGGQRLTAVKGVIRAAETGQIVDFDGQDIDLDTVEVPNYVKLA